MHNYVSLSHNAEHIERETIQPYYETVPCYFITDSSSYLLSAVTFIYIESTSDLAIKKPPLPDKREQKDILKRKVGYKKKPSWTESKWSFFSPSCFCYRLVSSGKEGQSDDDCIEIDDDKEGKSIILCLTLTEIYMLFEKRKHERKKEK